MGTQSIHRFEMLIDINKCASSINVLRTQSIHRFEMLIDRMDAGFGALKADIHRLETELKTDRRWFNGLIVTSVIGALAILWQILKHLEVIQNSP